MLQTTGLEPISHANAKWTINIDSSEIEILRDKYPKIPDEEFNRTIQSAARILAQCPSPGTGSSKVTGLAIGKVQSGKTLSFTALIALAAANGYQRIIVLAGTKNVLLTQTYERLKKDLGITDPGRASRIITYDNPTVTKSDAVGNAINSGKCALLVVLKRPDRITNVRELLESDEVPEGPTLVIDDEGDEASLNNYFRQGRQSSTFQSIVNLRNILQQHAYVAYTATPQANLLLQNIDNLHPDFCELIEPGGGYCGGSIFFDEQRIDNFVHEIDDVEENVPENSPVPKSLKNALAVFFSGAAIRHIRSPGQKHSMIVHMTHKKRGHEQTKEAIGHTLREWRDILSLRQNDPTKQELMQQFRYAYDNLVRTVINPPDWNSVESRLKQELLSYELHMVNSLPEGVQIAETSFQLENNIVIGGNILSRGVTVQDLTVSYMSRRAKKDTNADTMEQRARWFGYKMDYLDLCRIYLPRRIIEDYKGILTQEDDFWDSLQRNLRQGMHIDVWPRFFRDAGLDLNPTRRSVAQFKKFQPQGWEQQTRPLHDSTAVENNIQLINDFFRSNNSNEEKIGTTNHTFVRACNIIKVINLLQNLKTQGTGWDSAYFLEYLRRLAVDRIQSVDVVWMANGVWRERRVSENKIDQLMQGPSPSDGSKYPGDRNFHNNKVQLQVHFVKCVDEKGNENKTTVLALYIPNEPQFDISYIIREELR